MTEPAAVPDSPSAPTRFPAHVWPWLVLALILALNAALRSRFLDVPLERDEGEYAYSGQLMLRGVPPYAQAYNMKMPGTYASYAVVMAVFGETPRGIHLGLIVINSATIVLLYLVAKYLFDPLTGLAAAASYAVLSVSQNVLGFTANAEHFVVLPALGGVLLLLWALDSARLTLFFLSGVLLGLAYIMKQHGVFFIVFGGVYLLYADLAVRPRAWSRSLVRYVSFGAGVFLPFGLVCLVLCLAGVFDKFWLWVFQYAAEYVSETPAYVGITYFPGGLFPVMASCPLLWGLALLGVDAALWGDPRVSTRWFFVISFLVCSTLAVFPGFYFRDHYFILMLPAVAFCAGIGFRWLSTLHRSPVALACWSLLAAVAVLSFWIYVERDYLFKWDVEEVSRRPYNPNPFVESLPIAAYLKEHTQPDDRIAVIGSEPQIYFYADRRSATGHIYTYALMENQKYASQMQQEMIREIEAARPEYLVYVNVPWSWLERSTSDRTIFEWFERYQKNYERVGLVVIPWKAPATYYWDGAARGYHAPKDGHWVSILKRKKKLEWD